MKQGTQFWYGIKIKDTKGNYIQEELVDTIVFNFDDLVKTYTRESEEVTYDEENKMFKIWLSQEETLKMQNKIYIDARIKFLDDSILGVYKVDTSIYDSLNKEEI